MGTKCVEADIKMESNRVPFVPPGFASFSTFSLKRIEDDEIYAHLYQTEKDCRFLNKENFKKTVQDKPWINYGQFSGSEVDLGSENPDHDIPSVSPLKQGVLRGYMGDKTCNQVLTRQRFEDGCRPILDEAPMFYPNEEEFKDTLRYIESIQPKVEPFGICRIVPPPSWKPPCPLKDKVVWENSMFSTHIQWLEKLQNRCPVKQTQCCSTMNRSMDQGEANLDCNEHTMKSCKTGCYIFNERFGFEPGPEFTLKAFEEHANSFKEKYFFSQDKASENLQTQLEPSIQDIEGQYWRIIEERTEEIEVLYGADIDTRVFGSGFPKAPSVDCDIENKYVRSGWNLNNTPRLSGSLLSFQGADISGITVPWLYIGMCFSSFCWHVEDHHFYSLSYLHWGAPKIWYGVPGKDALKHEAAMRKHLAALFNEQPDLPHHLVMQFSPATLRTEGVPVYRCIQHPGEFVLTFPRAYHCEFSCGFNCSEAVNLAPIDWLPHGQNAVELYRAQRRKTSISHDMLLFRAAKEAVRAQWNISFLNNPTPDYQLWRDACGQNKILTRVLKARVELEASRRELFCSSKLKKMDPNFDPNIERECFICHCDLYLSVATCSCSLDTYSCLEHAMQICSCDWRMRSFFHQYEISELNVMVDALAGKLSAVHKWGISDLGLSLRSYANKIKLQRQDPANQSSTEGKKRKTINCDESCALFTLNEQKSQPLSPQWVVEDAASFKSMFVGEKEAADHQVKDGCSSSGSYSFSNKGSQHSGENRLDDTQDASSYKESNSGKCSISAAKENRVVNLYDAKAGSVENADGEHNSGKCSISAAKENRVVSLYDAKAGSVENADSEQLGGQQKRLKYLQLSDKEEKEHKQTFLRDFEGDQPLTVDAKANASRITEKDIEFHPTISVYGHPSSAHLNIRDKGKDDTVRKKLPISVDVAPSTCLHHTRFSMDSDGGSTAKCHEKILPYHECENDTHSDNIKISIDTSLVRNAGNVGTRKQGKSKSPNVDSLVDDGNIVKNSPGPFYTKKGPATSKGVRSTNCLVEPLKYGVVLSGFFWSNEQAIFPKGYRSRSRYFNILEPNQVCYYISEILDGGHVGPLFMVQLEECPTEVFIHLSASKSWDAVRERLNNEIVRQHSLGNFNVPTLQPPGSVDGFSMFGFSSPKIIQVIESLDEHHVCTDYWRSRPNTPIENSRQIIQEQIGTRSSCVRGSESVLQGIIKKTNPEELQALHSVLTSDHPSSKLELIQLLNDEIERRVSH